MLPMRSLSIGLILFTCALSNATAQPQGVDWSSLYDDSAFQAAVSDIERMDHKELDLLAKAVVTCTDDFSQNGLLQHNCSGARGEYVAKYGRARPIDDLLLDLSSAVVTMINFGDSAQRRIIPAPEKLKPRLIDIEKKLRKAVNLALRKLNTK